MVLGLRRAEPLALDAPVGDGGAAGHPAEEVAVARAGHRGALAGDAAAGHGHGPREPRQVGDEGVVAADDARVGRVLPLQRGAADVVALERAEADRERGQRAAHDGDLVALGVEAQLVAVQRQAGLETQRVAGAETDGRGARGDERVPEGRPAARAATKSSKQIGSPV